MFGVGGSRRASVYVVFPIIEFSAREVWPYTAKLLRKFRVTRIYSMWQGTTSQGGGAKFAGKGSGYLEEWEEILYRPWPEIAELITSMSEDATRLRSSSPFAGVLDADEREQIYAAFRT